MSAVLLNAARHKEGGGEFCSKVSRRVYGRDEFIEGLIDGLKGRVDGWMDRLRGSWMYEWLAAWMDGWIEVWMTRSGARVHEMMVGVTSLH